MAELPAHTFQIRKRRAGKPDRVYTYYQRHRNTPDGWPRIALPEPLSADFAERHEICARIERRGGAFLLAGATLPEISSPQFWPAAVKAMTRFKAAGQNDKTFGALVARFNAPDNPAWEALAPSTRRGYERSAQMILDAWAADRPADLTAVDVQEAIDALSDTPATANQFRAYLSRLLAWGIPRGFCETNAAAASEKIKGATQPWEPWPEWAFDTLVDHAPFHLTFIAISALFTGQRQGDVLKLQRPREDLIAVKAQKTKSTVWIPVHSEYRKWIDRAPAEYARMAGDRDVPENVMLHLGERLRPYATADGFRSAWSALMGEKPFARFREERLVFHGLRKNATVALLEIGCTEAEAGSITNMSPEMVRHYGRSAQLKRLAKNAMRKLEEMGGEVLPLAVRRNGNGT